jgi:hypothetical protein
MIPSAQAANRMRGLLTKKGGWTVRIGMLARRFSPRFDICWTTAERDITRQ